MYAEQPQCVPTEAVRCSFFITWKGSRPLLHGTSIIHSTLEDSGRAFSDLVAFCKFTLLEVARS